MFVFKEINKSSTVIERNVVNYTQNLNTASAGINVIQVTSGSKNNEYWQSLNVLFYSSGSTVYGISGSNEPKFGSISSNLSLKQNIGKQHLTKFHGYPSSSIIQIPSTYYGDKIREKSFVFTDLNNSDNDGNNPIIKDDGKGNLYSTNANSNFGTLTASNNSITSSDNYVGNIFYNQGLAVITETGSWSGSVNYSDLGTNYTLKLDSSTTITTHEYDVTINPNEYNRSTNYTLRSPISGSLQLSTKYIASTFTSSDFQPYITQIYLWKDGHFDEPVIQANLPKPIRKSNKIPITFKIKLDL